MLNPRKTIFTEVKKAMGTTIPNKFTVVFLCNTLPPSKVVVLQRGDEREFAPKMYTGIGGKLEEEDGTAGQLTGALRELSEETGISDVALIEFGRLIVNGTKTLYYFASLRDESIPLPPSNEGRLEWVERANIFSKDVIPTTKVFLEEWQKREWNTTRPFTVRIERGETEDITSVATSVVVEEGLGL